ncbi:MAG: Spy/CpxP family protein refolding chaperone [Candidatus Aminicenantes bacterium]|nr:Spy/CpxP family protein refolding chaperone [Candidatus Aminicenantes bacterium]
MKKTVIVSFVTLGFLALLLAPLAAQEEPGRPMRPQLAAGAGFQQWLDLTPEQEAKLKEMRAARMKESREHVEKMRKMREDLRSAAADPKADPKKIDALVDEMHRRMADQMKSRIEFRKDMEKVFTPEQIEKLKNARFRRERMSRASRFMRRPERFPGMMGPSHFGWDRFSWGRGYRPGRR